jgi:putative ABC transport system permease protein
MFKNYFLVAWRNLRRNKILTLINVAGLAVGMACCLLILLYVKDEASYDRYHEKAGRVCRVFTQEFQNGRWDNDAGTPDLLGPALAEEYPEIEEVVRFFHPSWVDKWPVTVGGCTFYEENLFFADPTIFKVMSFPLVIGDPESALEKPNSLVLSEDAAGRYFGRENPLGKVLLIDNRVEATVTGVARNVPPNSHFRFDLLVSFESNPEKWALNNWRTNNFYTYLLFRTKPDPREFNNKLAAFVKKHFDDVKGEKLALQPLTDIHLHSKTFRYDMAANSGDASLLYIFSAVAAGILAIACINYMNLATARSAGRAREVGLRKVVGASRMRLVKQFLGESLVFSFLAAFLALLLLEAFLPAVNHLLAKEISLFRNNAGWIGLSLAGLAVLVALLAGSYPAFFLSAFYTV